MVMVAVRAVGAAFRLERGLQLRKLGAEAVEHLLDHMVGSNAKNPIANFGRQMPISQMPGKAHELTGFFMLYFDDSLGSGLDLQQPPVFKLQGISIGHRNRFRKVEKDVFALIRNESDAAAMARVEIERERTRRRLLGPVPRETMDESVMHRHYQYIK